MRDHGRLLESKKLPGPRVQIPGPGALRFGGVERQIVPEAHERVDPEPRPDRPAARAPLVEIGEPQRVAELVAIGPVRVVAGPVVVFAVHRVEESPHAPEEDPRQAIRAARRRAILVDSDPRLVGPEQVVFLIHRRDLGALTGMDHHDRVDVTVVVTARRGPVRPVVVEEAQVVTERSVRGRHRVLREPLPAAGIGAEVETGRSVYVISVGARHREPFRRDAPRNDEPPVGVGPVELP